MARKKKALHQGETVRAILYTRVSTDEQAKAGHFGVEVQSAQCDALAGQRGYTIIGRTQDIGISGAKGYRNRPGLLAAMEACAAGEADLILCYAQDRLARKSGVFDDIRDHARKYGYRLETVREGQDVASDENEIQSKVNSFVADVERTMIAKRLYGGRKEKAKLNDGTSSGPLPYGYRYDVELKALPNGEVIPVKHLAIDETAAAVVRLILRMLAEGAAYATIAAALNAAGHPTRSGGKVWYPSTVHAIAGRRDLYTAGQRVWDGITAAEHWPIIAPSLNVL
jgi:site-specific DNA recombinase